jgi:hypothetical protein
MPSIVAQLEKEKRWIERRLRENREKVAEDIEAGSTDILEEVDRASASSDKEAGTAKQGAKSTPFHEGDSGVEERVDRTD